MNTEKGKTNRSSVTLPKFLRVEEVAALLRIKARTVNERSI
jgi:hypothetical protein